MSLVGTRPILPDELEQYELHHRARIAIKPGITGMWQVSGRSDITDFEEIVRLDTEYISEHGVSIYPFALPKYLSYNLFEIEKLAGGGSMTKMNASIKIGGWLNFVKWAIAKILKKIKR